MLKGDVQSPGAPVSTVHWNVEPVSDEVNVNCGLATVERLAGLPVIVVFGGVVSIVHVAVADALLPAASFAVTWNVWLPSASGPG